MARRLVITGIGPVSSLGLGAEETWPKLRDGVSGLERIQRFDPSNFACHVGGEAPEYKIAKIVPKSYRKATKVMARDIELAVIAADLAARDAGLVTPGTAEGDEPRTYEGDRSACHIGAGLIAAELNELTEALVQSKREDGTFDLHQWGQEGMQRLTPLWLLKYLPNMLACHVTIIHDSRGPSNTITCAEASGLLSLAESARALQRGAADVGFVGGAETKLNPMAYLRQQFTGRLTAAHNDDPSGAVRSMDETGSGTVIGEGGGIVVLEALETYEARGASGKPYAELLGVAAAQNVNRAERNLSPDAEGRSIAAAVRNALRMASLEPEAIDLIVPGANGYGPYDRAEVAALRGVFGDRLAAIPLANAKPLCGNLLAGMSGLDLTTVCMALRHQVVPATVNRPEPMAGTHPGQATAYDAPLKHALVVSGGFGGQVAAAVLRAV